MSVLTVSLVSPGSHPIALELVGVHPQIHMLVVSLVGLGSHPIALGLVGVYPQTAAGKSAGRRSLKLCRLYPCLRRSFPPPHHFLLPNWGARFSSACLCRQRHLVLDVTFHRGHCGRRSPLYSVV